MQLAIGEARTVLRRAMQVRKSLGIPMDHAICVLDVAAQLGIEVWFKPLPSLAGMYAGGDNPVILIGSDRPAGYQSSTCGHEMGHHAFGHGTRVDEYIEGVGRSRKHEPEELQASLFGAHLLMPQAAVTRVFASRGWSIDSPTEEQVFVAAGQLGVGYQTLIHHLRWTIRSLGSAEYDRLLEVQPRSIRASLVDRPVRENVVVVDEQWADRPVDLLMGDLAILSAGTQVEGAAVEVVEVSRNRMTVRAIRRGLARAERPRDDWATFLRVMPKCHEGAAIHRHLEDPDER